MLTQGFTKTTEDYNADVRQQAESRGSLNSVQLTQGVVSQFVATTELTFDFSQEHYFYQRNPDL